MIDAQKACFRERLEMIEAAGVGRIRIEPGFGFALNLPDRPARVRCRADTTLLSFRFRELGWPACVTGSSSVYLFHHTVRSTETGRATLALPGKRTCYAPTRSAECSR